MMFLFSSNTRCSISLADGLNGEWPAQTTVRPVGDPDRAADSLFIFTSTFYWVFLHIFLFIFHDNWQPVFNLHGVSTGPSEEQTGSWFLIYNIFLSAHIQDIFLWKTVNLLIYKERCYNHCCFKTTVTVCWETVEGVLPLNLSNGKLRWRMIGLIRPTSITSTI